MRFLQCFETAWQNLSLKSQRCWLAFALASVTEQAVFTAAVVNYRANLRLHKQTPPKNPNRCFLHWIHNTKLKKWWMQYHRLWQDQYYKLRFVYNCSYSTHKHTYPHTWNNHTIPIRVLIDRETDAIIARRTLCITASIPLTQDTHKAQHFKVPHANKIGCIQLGLKKIKTVPVIVMTVLLLCSLVA